MAENSLIGWLKRYGINGATFNPWISCAHATYIGSDGNEHVHPGCLHCYAENMMDTRYGKCIWGSNGNRVVTSPDYWRKPDLWNRKAAQGGYRMSVFPSLCDPFEDWLRPMVRGQDDDGTPMRLWRIEGGYQTHRETALISGDPATMDHLRLDMFQEISGSEHLDWILLTKRPQNVRRMWHGGRQENVTLCYSPSNQETLNYGAPLILECGDLCQTVGISLEPMLGRVDLRPFLDGLGWLIIGCESDGARVGRLGDFSDETEWWAAAADVVRQCADAGVPCFMKQGPRDGRVVHDLLDFPASCRVQEFPGWDGSDLEVRPATRIERNPNDDQHENHAAVPRSG